MSLYINTDNFQETNIVDLLEAIRMSNILLMLTGNYSNVSEKQRMVTMWTQMLSYIYTEI
jgi:hypothetical protein